MGSLLWLLLILGGPLPASVPNARPTAAYQSQFETSECERGLLPLD
jgi:hypothetical protein